VVVAAARTARRATRRVSCTTAARTTTATAVAETAPYYTQPKVVYHVTGSDPYDDLDSNNNGLGCDESQAPGAPAMLAPI
jgi:hypothetical protein